MLGSYIFKESSYRYAIAGSLLWHLFWSFFISVDIYPQTSPKHSDSRIYFLGPVLTDDAFNVIVDTRTELGQTNYTLPEDLSTKLEPDVQSLGRRSPGDLLSIPLHREAWSGLSGALNVKKQRPKRIFYERFPINLAESPFEVTGDLSERAIFSLPSQPIMVNDLKLSLEQELVNVAEFEIEADHTGEVVRVQNIISSGDMGMDHAWEVYLKQWQFMPLPEAHGENQTGRIRIEPERSE